MTINDEQKRVYLDHGGTSCPNCGGADLTGGPVEVDAGRAAQPMRCESCAARWRDEYVLVQITVDGSDA